jgi:molecular chaperone DnaK (HSP70)
MVAEDNTEGGWIGIDLGTSNCTAAVWDLSRSRCKVLRLGHENLARPPTADVGGRKGGKIVPSAVSFRRDGTIGDVDGVSSRRDRWLSSIVGSHGLSVMVGHAASQSADETDEMPGKRSLRSRALVTSFKRVVGMTSREAKELKSSDPDFWNSLPFECVTDMNEDNADDSGDNLQNDFFDVLGDATEETAHQSQTDEDIQEGVAIRIHPLNFEHPSSNSLVIPPEHLVTPLQVTTILLHAIRAAAIDYLTHNNRLKIQVPGLQDDTSQINNCVIGVPAHYSHAQRTAIRNAAKNAGFRGHVSVMTESTAAAMAYGLFVSPTASIASNNDVPDGVDAAEKNILVFDMGGGTTDVTIATIGFGKADKVQFRVMATAGDRRLGGDNVDESIARYMWKKHAPTLTASERGLTWKASEHRELVSECRRAKEELCGNTDDKSDGRNFAGIAEAHVTFCGKTVALTRQEFDSAIQPLVDRAERVVEDALSALESCIHEVVLVGASTHIPTVRSMLRRRFPPPIPPELCTSISAETAVAQGLAIQAALVSGLVPLWELRNAMMMDVLPHSIGVWVSYIEVKLGAGKVAPFMKGQIIHPGVDGESQGYYVPILQKDAPLPAMGSAAFTLAAADQPGVTVISVEKIGPGDVFQCMGVFDFLLCRLNKGDDSDKVRQVKIGMTLETSGEFTVSIYDEKDPDHREKRRRYLKEKASQDGSAKDTLKDIECFYEEDEKDPVCSGTEISLAIFCIISFALYVAARVAFRDADMSHANDEL